MYQQEMNSQAIGLHTHINQVSAEGSEKASLQNGCSIAFTEITQVSRSFSNLFTTPDVKSEEYSKNRRFLNNLSYKRRMEIMEQANEKPVVAPPVTKKIKKKLDLRKKKGEVQKVKKVEKVSTPLINSALSYSEKVTLYDWLLQSVEGLKLSRTVFYLTIITLQNTNLFSRENAQLVATTCLFTQATMDVRSPPPIEQFEQITQGFVTTSAIKDFQFKILKDLGWKLPRFSLLDTVFEILLEWDQFVLDNPTFINPDRSQKCMFMSGKYQVQNFVQLMAIVDSLKVLSIVNEKNISIVIFSLLMIHVGLEFGHSSLQTIPSIDFIDYLPYQIIRFFVVEKCKKMSISPNLVAGCLKSIYRVITSVMGILIQNKPCVIEEVHAVRTKAKAQLKFEKQFYFEGMVPT